MPKKKVTTGIRRVCLMFKDGVPWAAIQLPTTMANDLLEQFKKGKMPEIVSGPFTQENGDVTKKSYKSELIVGIEIHER